MSAAPTTELVDSQRADSERGDSELEDEAWRPPGFLFADHLRDGHQELRRAGAQLPAAPRFSDAQLCEGVESLDAMAEHTMLLIARAVAEALTRGVHAGVGLSAHDWTARRCAGLSPTQISDVVTIAQALGDPIHEELGAAIEQGRLPVRRAASVLRSLRRIQPILDGSEYADAMVTLMDVAQQRRFNDRDLKTATDCLLSAVLPERDHEARDQAARQLRAVNESSLADGSYVRFIVTCEPEGAAALRALLHSTLAAPCPDQDGPDRRTAVQRRYDALLTIVRRGVEGSETTPATPTARVIVTMAWDTLEGALSGTGTTLLGDVLSPETVRKLACDAELIPIVLGTDNEILSMGRTKRLVTPGQRTLLEHRDRGCTYPGCSIPAGWTDAHHVTHWSRHGPSDIPNYALLCGRHHTLVHERDLWATVTATSVRWHI